MDAIKLRQRVLSAAWSSVVSMPIILGLSVVGSIIVARGLGPERLAVITAINAIAATIGAIFDFGVTKSLAKIIPDVAVRLGSGTAKAIARRLLLLQFGVYGFSWVVLVALDWSELWHTRRQLGLSAVFLMLLGLKIVSTSFWNIYQGVTLSALRGALLNGLSTLHHVAELVLIIVAVTLTKNPYVIVAVMLLGDAAYLFALRFLGAYDLDSSTSVPARSEGILRILRPYAPYVGMTYLNFLFSRIVGGAAAIFWLMVFFRFDRSAIANASLGWSLAAQFVAMADLPLTQVNAPILARLHAQEDEPRFQRAQEVMVAVAVICSSVLLCGVAGVGKTFLTFLYGPEYLAAVTWGVNGAMFGLLLNFFSVGNRALQQRNQFRPQLIGLGLAVLLLPVEIWAVTTWISQEGWPFAFLMCVLGARGTFWIFTDIWTDVRGFHWRGIGLKTKGIAACLGALLFLWSRGNQPILQAVCDTSISLVFFWILFRFLGGVGKGNREAISTIVHPRLRALVQLF